MNKLILPKLRPDQLAIAIHQAKRKYICCGRRWGKSTLGGILVVNVLRQHGSAAWIVPFYKNSRPLWRWITRVVRPFPDYFKVNEAERAITTHNGGYLGVYSADNISSIRGDRFHLVVVDEAARISEDALQEDVEPTLADYGGDLVCITTPIGFNWFSDEWEAARKLMNEEAAAWRAPSYDNPIQTIRRAYELARARLPAGKFAQEWDAMFIAPGGTIFQREWFSHSDEQYQVAERWVSFDTALKEKEQNDPTAYCVFEMSPDYRLHLVDSDAEHLAFPNLPARIVNIAEKWNYDGKLIGWQKK